VEKGHPVSVLEGVIQVWLEAWHGTQVAIDKGDASLLGGHVQVVQDITYPASDRQL
jgi:hypothetical protein